MIVAAATDCDLPEIVALVNSAYRGDSARLGWTHEADLVGGQRTDIESLRRDLSQANPTLVLCLREAVDEPILASVFLERIEGHDGAVRCYMSMLTVKPVLQDRGLGRLLMGEAEKQARAWGADWMEMTVIHGRNTLIAYYERRGYRRSGETLPFPYADPIFGRPNCDGLYFLVLEKAL